MKSHLNVALAEIPETVLVPAKHLSSGSIGARIAYGTDMSLLIAERQPGYHSKPHLHDAEQLNYVLAGELWVFVEDTGFHARQGDVFRIPRNAMHWSWVQGDVPCVLLETHAPALIGDPGVKDTAHALLSDDERREAVAIGSVWPTDIDRDAVEARMLGEKIVEMKAKAVSSGEMRP
jgi:mannose-6-phosphate isomerase-like protein (cupin superfamily)